MNIRFSIVALSCISLFGCTYGTKIRLSGAHYPPVPLEQVQILLAPPNRPSTTIGIVRARGAQLASAESVYRKLQKAAADLGADAVLVNSESVEPYATLPGHSYTSGTEYVSGHATARGYGDTVYASGSATGNYNETTTYVPPMTFSGTVVKGVAIKFIH